MTANKIYRAIIFDKLDTVEMITILELITQKIPINTISEMARIEGKSPNGIKVSKKYRKLKIGKQLMCVRL